MTYPDHYCAECGHRIGMGARLGYEIDGHLICDECHDPHD